MPVDPQRVQALFLAAVESGNAAARAAVLDRECGADSELRQRIEALLKAHDEPDSFLDDLAADLSPTTDTNSSPSESAEESEATRASVTAESVGSHIGPYKLLEQIGEGGFGVVFMAEQTQPIRRKVALKVLKPGMDTRQVVARFEVERQVLALMDHPHIAHVFDGGETATGRPYFVMELVKGIPINDFCDRDCLSIRERLGLFVDVCQAVQHAHQKGIIHRDLKPSNVLVTWHDGTPVVKVIDFGIAKATGQQLTEKTLLTNFAQMIGTPLYMSPEQSGMSGLDIDTRSDIYSLGVLLYELLTGTTPFDKEQLKEMGYDELRRIIREEEPPKPSTRLSTLGQASTTIATRRQSDPKRLSQLLRGELDWIVMKALEKDRNRRYETANGLARDIERYLHDEPVQACPPSAAYRLGKFARRHRAALATLVLVVAALLTTVVALVVSNISISREEKEKSEALIAKDDALKEKSDALVAKGAALEATNASRQQAETRLTLILAALDEIYITEAERRLAAYRNESNKPAATQDPRQAQVERDFLQKGMGFYEKLIQPGSAEPAARFQTGKAYRRVGILQRELNQYDKAADSLAKAVSLLDKLAEEDSTEPQYRWELAQAYRWQGLLWGYNEPRRLREAEQAYRRAIALADKLVAEFRTNPEYRIHAATYRVEFGMSLRQMGQPEKAEVEYHEAVKLWEELVVDFPKDRWDRHELAYNLDSLGWLWQETAKQPEKAEPWFRKALKYHEELVAENPADTDNRARLVRTHEHLAQVLTSMGRLPDAEKARRAALAVLGKLVADFPHNTDYQQNLIRNQDALLQVLIRCASEAEKDGRLSQSDRKAAAQAFFDKAKEIQHQTAKRLRDPEALNDLATQMIAGPEPRLRDPAHAVELAKRAVALAPRSGRFWATLGLSQYRAGDHAKAVPALTRSLTLNGANVDDFLFLAMAHWQRGQKEEAQQWYNAGVLRMQHGSLQFRWHAADLDRLRREAEALMGLDHAPTLATAQIRLYDPECYTRIIAAQPEAAWAYQLRGQIYRRLRNTKQADADAGCAAELLERNLPTGPDALKELERAGSYYMRSNSWDMAVIFYSKAIEFKNAELWYYNERGFAYSVLEQYHEAVSDYTKVIALDPRRGNYYARRGYAYLRCGEQEKALADYAKVLELNPDYSNDGWSLHCARMLVAGLGGRAAALVEKLVRDFPDEPRYAEQLHNVHSELAANFIRARRFTDAEKSYSEAIKHKPDDAMLWLRRADFYARLGLWDLAAKDSAAAFKLQPPATPNLCLSHAVLSLYIDDLASYRQLCALIPKRFGPDTDYRGWDCELTRACTIGPAPEADVVAWAMQRAERGVKRDPAPWDYCALGRAYFRARKYEQAVTQLKRCLELKANWYAREALTYPVLAMAYHHLGQADKAKESLEKASRGMEQLSDRLVRAPAGAILPTSFWNNWVEFCLLYREANTLIEGSPPPDDPRWHVARANAFTALGDQKKAIDSYSKAIELKPTEPSYWYVRGGAYFNFQQYDKALDDFSKAIELKPDYAEAWNDRGAAHGRLKQNEKAIADYSQAIQLKPDFALALNNRASQHAALGQSDKAIDDYSKAIELKPTEPSYWYKRGSAYFNFQQYDKALDDYSKAIELKPDYAEAWHDRGVARGRLKQNEKAIADYSQAIQLKPDFALALNNRASQHAALGQWDKAAADFAKVCDLQPKVWWYRRNLAYALAKQGRRDEARIAAAKAVEVGEKDAAAWIAVGNFYRDFGEFDDALRHYNKAMEVKPDEADAWYQRGQTRLMQGKWDRAVADFSATIERAAKSPGLWLAYRARAGAYTSLRQFAKALADYEKVVQLTPKSGEAHNNLAWLLAACPEAKYRDATRAVELAKKAVQLAPKDGNNWGTLGTAHYRAGQWKEAIAALDKSRALKPGWDAYAWLFLAMTHRKLGHDDESRKAYDQAIDWLESNQELLAKNKPQAEELRRFRSEAEDVLELKKK